MALGVPGSGLPRWPMSSSPRPRAIILTPPRGEGGWASGHFRYRRLSHRFGHASTHAAHVVEYADLVALGAAALREVV